MNNSSFYDEHFRLDDTNTQHFYEDIGKYPRYVFGWTDWFQIYSKNNNGEIVSPDWICLVSIIARLICYTNSMLKTCIDIHTSFYLGCGNFKDLRGNFEIFFLS